MVTLVAATSASEKYQEIRIGAEFLVTKDSDAARETQAQESREWHSTATKKPFNKPL
jgi:hypothetical protein